jgi:hypothetical protein
MTLDNQIALVHDTGQLDNQIALVHDTGQSDSTGS